MRRISLPAALALTLLVSLFPTAAATADEGTHSDNISHVKQLEYEARNGGSPNAGTDIEFAEIDGGEYALAGTYRNGLQIVDISEPTDAEIVSVYDCGITQGDMQVFERGERTYATYTSDTYGDGTSPCYQEAAALGFETRKANGSGRNGTFIVDLTDPLTPTTVSFVEVPQGSHNQTVHPSGDFLYNSNSDLITTAGTQAIEIYDIRDFSNPELVTELALPLRPGLGTESHDITFNADGSRAYSAALSQTVIINTENPAEPEIVSSFVDPAINVEHQSDPVTLTDPETGETRDFLIVEDEYAGAAGGPHCPSGGVHVYDITGDLENNPTKVGYWNIDDMRVTEPTGRCTAHVFDVHEDEGIMTIAFYNGGVRVVDLRGLVGYSLGATALPLDDPMVEIAHYYFDDSDTWAAKTPKIHPVTGDFYLYSNDQSRGMDIFKFEGDGVPPGHDKPGKSANQGTWMTPAEALSLPRLDADVEYTPYCLLPQI
jgi:hypothetical protein